MVLISFFDIKQSIMSLNIDLYDGTESCFDILQSKNKHGKRWNKKEKAEIHNFIDWSSLTISLKLGRLEGSRSQHFFISLTKASGVFFGIFGLISLLRTSIDTWSPDKSKF